jgi:hypothetical protein
VTGSADGKGRVGSLNHGLAFVVLHHSNMGPCCSQSSGFTQRSILPRMGQITMIDFRQEESYLENAHSAQNRHGHVLPCHKFLLVVSEPPTTD